MKRIPQEKISDIEKLMKIAQKVVDLENHDGITLLNEETDDMKKVPLLDLSKEFQQTNEQLTKYAREKCIKFNKAQATSLLQPLLDLRKQDVRITIFSTNYDTTIESVCEEQNIPYIDGFSLKKGDQYPQFRPSIFADSQSTDTILLYKLHGSVNWWYNDARKVVFKLDLELNDVPDIRNLMIYPAQKEDVLSFPYNYIESEFIVRLRQVGELIAVGHKFGDVNIASAVKVALERADFRLILVNPDAEIIKRDVFGDHKQVVAIPKKFEDWVKDDLTHLILEPEKKEASSNKGNVWVIEEFHEYASHSLYTPFSVVVRDCKLRCPSCGHSQYLTTKSNSGNLMCDSCKKIIPYILQRDR